MNILDYNHCTHASCNALGEDNTTGCGWNITISGTSTVQLIKIKKALADIGIEKDLTNYTEKLGTEPFTDIGKAEL